MRFHPSICDPGDCPRKQVPAQLTSWLPERNASDLVAFFIDELPHCPDPTVVRKIQDTRGRHDFHLDVVVAGARPQVCKPPAHSRQPPEHDCSPAYIHRDSARNEVEVACRISTKPSSRCSIAERVDQEVHIPLPCRTGQSPSKPMMHVRMCSQGHHCNRCVFESGAILGQTSSIVARRYL